MTETEKNQKSFAIPLIIGIIVIIVQLVLVTIMLNDGIGDWWKKSGAGGWNNPLKYAIQL